MGKDKIIILGKLPPPYMGPSIATEIILSSSLNKDFEIIHLDTGINKEVETIGRFDGLKILKNTLIYLRFIRLIIKHRPKLILIPISQTTVGFLKDSVYILLAKLFCRKVLLHLRGSVFKHWLDHSSVWIRGFVVFVLRRSQGVIVLGNKLRAIFEEYFTRETIFVVPNGGNYKIPTKSNESSDVFQILYLANLFASKGIEDVTDACVMLQMRSEIKFHVTLVGGWQNAEVRQRCIKKIESVHAPVTIHPPTGGEEKMSELSKADIFLFPPREPEGHPWVIVEAMAAGLPIISTDQGAITESVFDGLNGFIVDVKSPVQIEEKIMYLYKNPTVRIKMGKESRRLYEEKFTEEKMIQNLKNVFEFIIHPKFK